METLTGTLALITGASSGIGEGIAKMLAAAGVKVALVARRQHELERVAQAIRNLGGIALTAPADLRDEQALRVVIEQTSTRLGPIEILVNSGGIVETTPIHETDMQAWDDCPWVEQSNDSTSASSMQRDKRKKKWQRNRQLIRQRPKPLSARCSLTPLAWP